MGERQLCCTCCLHGKCSHLIGQNLSQIWSITQFMIYLRVVIIACIGEPGMVVISGNVVPTSERGDVSKHRRHESNSHLLGLGNWMLLL